MDTEDLPHHTYKVRVKLETDDENESPIVVYVLAVSDDSDEAEEVVGDEIGTAHDANVLDAEVTELVTNGDDYGKYLDTSTSSYPSKCYIIGENSVREISSRER